MKKFGFTLIELLVSMTILVVMTLIMIRVISDSSRAVELGYQQAMMDGNARAFLDTVLDDLNQAFAVDRMPMRVSNGAITPYNENHFRSHTLLFRALLGPDENCNRTTKLVKYDVDMIDDYYVIRRGEKCGDLAGESIPNIYPLLDYVVQFKINLWGYDAAGNLDIQTNTEELPEYAEIMISLVSPEIHARAMRMSAADRRSYLVRHGRRHYVQTTFPMANARFAEFDYFDN